MLRKWSCCFRMGRCVQKIDYNDKKVLDSLGTGRTDGVFQLESAGMKSFMKELKPQSLEDVIAGISLYRPGPMDFIPQYIRGKNRPDTIRYDCPQMEPILKPTYGCIVYQEQEKLRSITSVVSFSGVYFSSFSLVSSLLI